MDRALKIPFYAKAALIFISAFALIFTLHIGKQIIVPIVYASILAILLNPLVNYLVRKRLNRLFAIAVSVTLTIIVVFSSLYLMFTQLSMFGESYPQLKKKFAETSSEFVGWISHTSNIRVSKINAWTKETQSEAIDDFALGESLSEAGEMIMVVVLLPVYLFMILYYKYLLLEFLRRLFRSEHRVVLDKILKDSKRLIETYLVGLVFELVIVAVLNCVGLLILGIQYAIILGIIGAFLNLIPYLGGIVAIALPMVIAYITNDSLTYPLLVFCVYMLIQFIDNNLIIPKIVASRVKINALVSIVAVLLGGAIWGISGMFLSIPLIAIIKVICDYIEPLKPWGYLLGDVVPTATSFQFLKTNKTKKESMIE
jgi:predicted PurR-regulated permease PerM